MSNELACSFEDFKRRGKEFIDMAPTATTIEELDQLWKMIALSYLNMDGRDDGERHQAAMLLRILAREMIRHEVRLGVFA